MDISKEKLEVSEGALVILSQMPFSCDLKRGAKTDLIWLPKLLIAIPEKDNPFILSDESIKQKNTPYYIKHKESRGATIWYGDESIKEKLNLCGYILTPGEIKNEYLKTIYTFKNSFIPDKKDPNQQRLDINLVSGMDDFSYSDRNRFFTAKVRIKDLPQIAYVCLSSSGASYFSYDCEHTAGGIGLSSNLKGKKESSDEQIIEASIAIQHDLEEKLEMSFYYNEINK